MVVGWSLLLFIFLCNASFLKSSMECSRDGCIKEQFLTLSRKASNLTNNQTRSSCRRRRRASTDGGWFDSSPFIFLCHASLLKSSIECNRDGCVKEQFLKLSVVWLPAWIDNEIELEGELFPSSKWVGGRAHGRGLVLVALSGCRWLLMVIFMGFQGAMRLRPCFF